jgi:hypothetical protein
MTDQLQKNTSSKRAGSISDETACYSLPFPELYYFPLKEASGFGKALTLKLKL